MPLNVRRFSSSIFLVLFISVISFAQAPQAANQPSPVPANTTPVKTLTAGEIMRERISKAKAFIAVRNYNAAIYELEMVRRETSDQSVHAGVNILLMNSYLEQGNYQKAQNSLNEAFKNFKAGNANAPMMYSAVAGQVVKGARNQIERYRSLGLSVSDRNLPLEAVNDIEKMREMLELVITQTKETSADKARSAVALPLFEEATTARSSLGRDEYDAKRWRDAAVDAREDMASSRSVVINATDGTTVPQNTPIPSAGPASANSSANLTADGKPSGPQTGSDDKPQLPKQEIVNPSEIALNKMSAQDMKKTPQMMPVSVDSDASPVVIQPAALTSSGPFEVGSLLAYVAKQTPATYPPAARSMRASGVVKVEVVVDENGDVAEVKKANGPTLLQGAATDAIRKWKFRPVLRDGQAVRISGFVNFNFSL